jgi:hypothetical protein
VRAPVGLRQGREQTFDKVYAFFAYADPSDLNASHKRAGMETDLIGAYSSK